MTESQMVSEAWAKACDELNVSMRITPDIAKLVSFCLSSISAY